MMAVPETTLGAHIRRTAAYLLKPSDGSIGEAINM
jgi:hypothetical protein